MSDRPTLPPAPGAPDFMSPEENHPWKYYSPEQKAAVEEMAAWQERQNPPLSDRKFCTGSPYTESTWSRLKRGIYAGKLDETIKAFQRHIVILSEARMKARNEKGKKLIRTIDYDLVDASVKNALVESQGGGQDKLVCYVGDFGCGKTTLARYLVEEYQAVLVEAMPSWKVSYYAVCQTIAESIGLRKQFSGAAHAEREVIAQLKLRPRTLIFEEVEYTGSQLLNLWKLLVNQTECVVVVCFITRFFHELRRRGGEYADQLLRRADVIFAHDITAATAGKFLDAHWHGQKDKLREAAQVLANAANKKGGMHLCTSVVRMLHQEFGSTTPTVRDVEDKIESYRLMKQYSTTTAGA